MTYRLSQKRVLVTGATGFIGSNLVHRLLAQGCDVHIVTRANSDLQVLDTVLNTITVHRHDGTSSGMVEVLAKANPKIIFHLASLFLAQHKSTDIEALISANLLFSTQLVEAMVVNGIKYIVNTGTSWQHFNNEDYNPVNLYAATKEAFQALLTYYVEAQGLNAITLKLFDTYGPGDTRPKLFSLLRKAARSGATFKMSPGEQLLDLVFIDDVLDAYLLAMARVHSAKKHEYYAVSSPTRLSLRELVRIYGETVGRSVNVEWGGLPYRHREVLVPWTNYERIPGWSARVALVDGITRMEKDVTLDGLLVF